MKWERFNKRVSDLAIEVGMNIRLDRFENNFDKHKEYISLPQEKVYIALPLFSLGLSISKFDKLNLCQLQLSKQTYL